MLCYQANKSVSVYHVFGYFMQLVKWRIREKVRSARLPHERHLYQTKTGDSWSREQHKVGTA